MEMDKNLVTYYEDHESTKEFHCLLDQLRLNKQFCDVILIAEGTEFPVHKVILSATSLYFNKMFESTSGFIEKTLEKIELKEIKSEVLMEIIEFCYKRKANITEQNAQLLYAAANLLQYKSLKEMCTPIICKSINIESCFDILQFAKLHDDILLIDSVSAFIGNNFNEIIQKKEFYDFTYEQFLYILNRTEIIFENEESIFEGIIIWINKDNENREKYFIELIKFVKMNNLSTIYLSKIVSNETLMNNMECYSMIIKAYQFNDYFKNNHIFLGNNKNVSFYNIEEKKWNKLTDMPTQRCGFEAIVLDNKLYVLGGQDGAETTNIVQMYDPNTNSWQSMCSMLNSRYNFETNILNGKIYVVGGSDGNEQLKSAEVYDPKINQWKLIPNMLFSDIYSLVIKNNSLFLIGQENQINKRRMVQSYDPIKYNWTLEPEIQTGDIFIVQTNRIVSYYYSTGKNYGNYTFLMSKYRSASFRFDNSKPKQTNRIVSDIYTLPQLPIFNTSAPNHSSSSIRFDNSKPNINIDKLSIKEIQNIYYDKDYMWCIYNDRPHLISLTNKEIYFFPDIKFHRFALNLKCK